MSAKARQISVRVLPATDLWLERRAGRSNKAEFIRKLLEKEMSREREEELLEVFNKAAADLTEEDRAEREALLGAFSGEEAKPRGKRKK